MSHSSSTLATETRDSFLVVPSLVADIHTTHSVPQRSANLSSGQNSANNGGIQLDPQQPVLVVTPLNSMPYPGPPLPYATTASPTEVDTGLPTRNQPSMVFIPPHPAEKAWDDLAAATKSGVRVTGSAALGKVGPALGSIDIGESEETYLFRVSLPGVANDERFSYNVEPNGKILIKGVTSTGEKRVHRINMVFEMQTQNLSPPGEFSISFRLPGPVDHQQVTANFGLDGIFEAFVKKRLQQDL